MTRQKKRIKLSKKSFTSQMLSYGYFYEQLPPCFTSEKLALHNNAIFTALGKEKPVTSPLLFSIRKTEDSRRTIAIPNPWSFAHTLHILNSNLSTYLELAKSKNSHSPITFIDYYDDPINGVEVINSESQRERLSARSSFVENLKERLIIALGRPYKLTIDLATFYDSIYTHSLSWSVCGKEQAKRWHTIAGNKKAREHLSLKPRYYDQADAFDAAIRRQKNNETNGVLTGPFTSRIFSEMLLCGIDKLFSEMSSPQNGCFVFRRYVDDYSFYFRSQEEAEQSLVTIERTLHEFGLRINQSKVSIKKYPFDLLSNLSDAFRTAYENQGVFGTLNQASLFSEEGEKGAYKYALKWLRGRITPEKTEQADLSMLVNIGITYPNCATLALERIKERDLSFGSIALGNALNQTISKALDYQHDQEVLNGLFYCRELDLQVDASNILRTIQDGNDLCKIIALDYVRHRTSSIESFEDYESEIDKAKDGLQKHLATANTDGDRWLLIFESLNHDLMDVSLGEGVTSELMRLLGEMEVSFFTGFSEPTFDWAR